MRLFENRVQRRIFGPKRDEVKTEWGTHIIKSSVSSAFQQTSRRMRWERHVARMGRREVYTEFWWGNTRERDHLEDPGLDGRLIIRWVFKK
jgi:hypothetical protein